MRKAVAHQPVSVAIEAGGRALQLYESVRANKFGFVLLVLYWEKKKIEERDVMGLMGKTWEE